MQPAKHNGSAERKQLQEKAWIVAERGVALVVALSAGLFVGYQLWGRHAGNLQDQVAQLQDRVTNLQKERDTLNGQKAIIERDKREVEGRLRDVQARCAVPAEAVPAGRP